MVHQAGKAKPGTRHAVLAFDKPTFVQRSGPVSAEHMRGDKALQDRLDASRPDRLPAGADEHLPAVEQDVDCVPFWEKVPQFFQHLPRQGGTCS